MKAAGREIASNGLKWIEYRDMVPEERAQIRDAIRLLEEVTGMAPRGRYTGRCSMNTGACAAEKSDLDYISDVYADALTYWIKAGRDPLIVPCRMDCNDMRLAILPNSLRATRMSLPLI